MIRAARRLTGRGQVAAAGVAVAMLVLLGLPSPSAVASTPAAKGVAIPITTPDGSSDLAVGAPNAQNTPFGLRLPQGAACPGDTMHDAYHLFGYIVPSAQEMATTSFATQLPQPKGWLLVALGEVPYQTMNTAANTGGVPTLPGFTFHRFLVAHPVPSRLIPAGHYDIGIACATPAGAVTNYWHATVAIERGATGPATWSVVSSPPAAKSASSKAGWVVAGVILAAAAAAGVLAWWAARGRRRAPAPSAGRPRRPATARR